MRRRTSTLKWPVTLTAVGVALVAVVVAVYATTWVATGGRANEAQPLSSPNSSTPGSNSPGAGVTATPSTDPTQTIDPTETVDPGETTGPGTTTGPDAPPGPTTPGPTTRAADPPPPPPPSAPEQTCATLTGLKFCDDFNGPAGSPPDSSKWRILTGSSWGGQCFRNERENIALNGQGQLQLTLIDKGSTQCIDGEGYETTVTSGGMDTSGRAYFKYGRFEIRAKLSCAKSVWGAIWLSTGTGPGWPQSGEIDFYELFENKQATIKHTIHAGNPYWNAGATHTFAEPLCRDYHVYGGEWREGYIQFTVDGKPTARFTRETHGAGKPWPFDSYDLRLIIDLQYGSPGWPAAGSWDKSELPSSMLIDYVRVFE